MQRSRLVFVLSLICWACGSSGIAASAEPLRLILPTRNDALYRGNGADFYMYTDRTYREQYSEPWEGGQYGYVRNPKETAYGVFFTRFHEGLDIRPVYRDARGEPLDSVRAIDDGKVVYVNAVAANSSYGKYVVVEHWWSGAPFYSLYAHLNAVTVREGQRLAQGQRLGMLGYTGRGIDRRRAHLHFEINLLLNQDYAAWHAANVRGANRHDAFHGYNLAGLDVARLYLALYRNPSMRIEDYFAHEVVNHKVAVPNDAPIDLLERYPFLTQGASGEPRTWEISFSETGVPLRAEPSSRRVYQATVTMVPRSDAPYSYVTGGTVSGSGRSYALTTSGKRYLSLLTLPSAHRTAQRRPIAGASTPVRQVVYEVPEEAEAEEGPPQEVEAEATREAAVETPTEATAPLSLKEYAQRVADRMRARDEAEARAAGGQAEEPAVQQEEQPAGQQVKEPAEPPQRTERQPQRQPARTRSSRGW